MTDINTKIFNVTEYHNKRIREAKTPKARVQARLGKIIRLMELETPEEDLKDRLEELDLYLSRWKKGITKT